MADQVLTKTIQVHGTELHYIDQGSGEVVIFVHGSISDYRTWMPQVDAFSQKYRAIAYSRRYHYPNAWSGQATDYTVGLHADDMIGLIEALDVGPVYGVGNSFGAYTLLTAATRRPDLLRKLAIGEPPIVSWLKDIPGGQPYWDDFMGQVWQPASLAFREGHLEEGVRIFIDGVSGKQGAFDHIPPVGQQRMLDNARELAAETVSPGYFTGLTPQQAESITVPMLLLRGENSPRMFHLILDRLAQALPGARQATIPNASHSIPSNNPEAYNQVVMDFFR